MSIRAHTGSWDDMYDLGALNHFLEGGGYVSIRSAYVSIRQQRYLGTLNHFLEGGGQGTVLAVVHVDGSVSARCYQLCCLTCIHI